MTTTTPQWHRRETGWYYTDTNDGHWNVFYYRGNWELKLQPKDKGYAEFMGYFGTLRAAKAALTDEFPPRGFQEKLAQIRERMA